MSRPPPPPPKRPPPPPPKPPKNRALKTAPVKTQESSEVQAQESHLSVCEHVETGNHQPPNKYDHVATSSPSPTQQAGNVNVTQNPFENDLSVEIEVREPPGTISKVGTNYSDGNMPVTLNGKRGNDGLSSSKNVDNAQQLHSAEGANHERTSQVSDADGLQRTTSSSSSAPTLSFMSMTNHPAVIAGDGRNIKMTTIGSEELNNGDGNNRGRMESDSSVLFMNKNSKNPTLPAHRSYFLENKGEPNNLIYHKVHYSEFWLCLLLLMHIGQWIMLLTVGYDAMSGGTFAVVFLLVVAVAVLMVGSRMLIHKSQLSRKRNIILRGGVCTPSDEADDVPDMAVYFIATAALIEGIAYAIFAAVTSGNQAHLNEGGFYTQDTVLQTLRFASITLLAMHRTIRPANRLDPMRTVLELEVVAVCWDALDGSTLYELLDGDAVPSIHTQRAIRTLMSLWYLSVGVRMALMFCTHLKPNTKLYQVVSMSPLRLAPQPTVDRTLQGVRLRSVVTMAMACADFYAASARLVLWGNGRLNSLQQDMCLKNLLFLVSFFFAFSNFMATTTREWNSRELLIFPAWNIDIRIPTRSTQLELFRWGFVCSYLLVASLLTVILVHVTDSSVRWVGNMMLDVLLVFLFLIYCRAPHKHCPVSEPQFFLRPRAFFFTFPTQLALFFSAVMACSLLAARLPAVYGHYGSMASEGSGVLWTYENAMLVVIMSVVPIAACGAFWSVSYMLFRKEFTASPGNYNAIHDPSINLVSYSTITEGALDVLSSATLMQLAANGLPGHVNNAIMLFCLLEMVNACQCFALQVPLSGGHDDTSRDLVRWNAYLRSARGIIDFGTIVLRIVLWIQYGAVSSVFLVKNLYNLIHTMSQVERYSGTVYYPKDTLFSEFVPPSDWYGMSKEHWRKATSDTVAAQAQAGRRV